MADDPVEAVAAAVKSARRMLAFVVFLTVVMIAVTFIDQGIKRAVIGEAQNARRVLDDFKKLMLEGLTDGTTTGPPAAGSGVRPDPGSDLDDVPRTPAAAGANARRKTRPAGNRAAGKGGGPGGDGQ